MKEALYLLAGKLLFICAYPVFLMMPQPRPRMRVIISDGNGNIALVKNWVGRHIWLLPGGGAHRHESDEAAAAREIKEEIGLDLVPESLVLLGDITIKRPLRPFRLRVFYTTIKHVPLTANRPEIIDAQWLPFSTLPDDFAQFKDVIL